MKSRVIFISLIWCGLFQFTNLTTLKAQEPASHYAIAMAAYEQKDYAKAAAAFNEAFERDGYKLSGSQLYNGACIYALYHDYSKAFTLLNYLAKDRYYSNLEHISNDTDLENMHGLPGWKSLIRQVSDNKETLPARTRARIKTELLKAKKILKKDAGKLWGEKIWSDNILVLDNDDTVYSLSPFPGSVRSNSGLYSKKISRDMLSQTNSVQRYEGRDYAVVMTSYLDDSCATIIHELFHILQNSKIRLAGDPVSYLDNHDAREWLRLEFQALRGALNAGQANRSRTVIIQMLEDALRYRKLRQSTYASFLDKELQIETMEGLANYTGYKLSAFPDKYQQAILEINRREKSATFTRPFPYATGLAYGLLFDHLGLKWRTGPGHVYNFLALYETLRSKIDTSQAKTREANERNNYSVIHQQELLRKQENENTLAYYMDLLVNKPTLKATVTDDRYSCSFDMNGTMTLADKGIVYSRIKGVDKSGNNFGNFTTLPGKEKPGYSGILGLPGGLTFIFPLPLSIEGNLIRGEFYELELHPGWIVKKINDKGDMEIVRTADQ